MYGLTVKTPPAEEPITLAEAKDHLRVDGDLEDDLIEGLIQSAREWAESWTQRAFVTQTLTLSMDWFPSVGFHLDSLMRSRGDPSIYLPRSPVQSVSEIRYVDTSEATVTLDASRYRVDLATIQPRIQPAYADTWPTSLPVMNALEVEFVAGYGAAADVPAGIKQAIKIMVATWYDTGRYGMVTGVNATKLPMTAEYLLGPFRVNTVAG